MKREYPERLVQRINELYFDIVNQEYHHEHPEIFAEEGRHWEEAARRFLIDKKVIADIGTGTGFVPLTIGRFVPRGNTIICADISQKMLAAAKKNIGRKKYACAFEYRKIQAGAPLQFPFADGSVQAITMNSVLHHIPDTRHALAEIDRILAPGGVVILGHEPNRYHNDNKVIRTVKAISEPSVTMYNLLLHTRVEQPLRKAYYRIRPGARRAVQTAIRRADTMNAILLKEGAIRKPFTQEELREIVDVRARSGFYYDKLFPNYTTLAIDTYEHVGTIGKKKGRMTQWWDAKLRKAYPRAGLEFFAVFQKPGGRRARTR